MNGVLRITAVHEDGVFKPLVPVTLKEGTEVVVFVLDRPSGDCGAGDSPAQVENGAEGPDDRLFRALRALPGDYKPWGPIDRDDPSLPGGGADCAGGCRHYLALEDVGERRLSYDWGVCVDPKSHRCGLLTFEHQGCPACEYDGQEGERRVASHERRRAEALARKTDEGRE